MIIRTLLPSLASTSGQSRSASAGVATRTTNSPIAQGSGVDLEMAKVLVRLQSCFGSNKHSSIAQLAEQRTVNA
jgi:hypothetical protein